MVKQFVKELPQLILREKVFHPVVDRCIAR